MPQWTLAFNLVALTMLLAKQSIMSVAAPTTLALAASKVAANPTATDLMAAAAAATGDNSLISPEVTAAATSTTATQVLLTPLKGLSQIYIVDSSLTGIGVASAVALYSPMLAEHALLGSTVDWRLLVRSVAGRRCRGAVELQRGADKSGSRRDVRAFTSDASTLRHGRLC
ncbi:hypothetical protein MPSEU_001075200 [Mayamaea pseudoterrestris]|nr:hypothetical protein MPSEU_001075200 [Mayamaea pseudoterrestris]